MSVYVCLCLLLMTNTIGEVVSRTTIAATVKKVTTTTAADSIGVTCGRFDRPICL